MHLNVPINWFLKIKKLSINYFSNIKCNFVTNFFFYHDNLFQENKNFNNLFET